MDEKKIALIGLDGAIREVIFFVDIFLARYESIKFFKNESLPEDKLRDISYVFNAFVRSAKSALDLMSKLSDEKKPDFMRRLSRPEGFDYLMKVARDAITHGSYDLIAGGVQIDIENRPTWVLVCAPICEDGQTWHSPPSQDGVSLAIDYLIAILKEAEYCFTNAKNLPVDYWDNIREWELGAVKATVHIPMDFIAQIEEIHKLMPSGFVPCLENTNWITDAINNCQKLRRDTHPTIRLERGRGQYHFLTHQEQQ